MNKVVVGLINSTATVPLQCCLSPCSAKRVKCKKKKKKERVKTQTQQSLVLSKRAHSVKLLMHQFFSPKVRLSNLKKFLFMRWMKTQC